MKRGVSRVSFENFWSHSAEKFRGHPFNVSENLGYRKILCIIGGITFFRPKILVSQGRKVSWASLQCFRKIGVSKNFMLNRGYHNFPSKFLVSQGRKVSWASLQCFRKIGVSKNFMLNRGYHNFPSKFFLSHSAEKFRKGILLFLRKFLVPKSFMDEKGGITIFRRKFFCPTVPKNFVKEPLSISLISGIKKCWGWIVKIFGTTEIRTPNLLLENVVVLTLLLPFTSE